MSEINSPAYWDHRFHSGDWELRAGRWQTRCFAACFLRQVSLPAAPFSLLDFGCALGEGVAALHAAAPHGAYAGCDISPAAIEKARQRYGGLARFFTADAATLDGVWDIILCSNVLEHVTEPLAVAERLLAHCRTLYVMTPYRETYRGQPIAPNAVLEHQRTFDEESFDILHARGLAAGIETTIDACRDAYIINPLHGFIRGVFYQLKGRAFREAYDVPPHIIFTIRSAGGQS
jgi:SAM-dependent methyltransferase